jgi:hypothetical protein
MSRCSYTDPANGRCSGPATQGAWCDSHYRILFSDAETSLRRNIEETKAALSAPGTTPARRRALWAHLRAVRAQLRLLGGIPDDGSDEVV